MGSISCNKPLPAWASSNALTSFTLLEAWRRGDGDTMALAHGLGTLWSSLRGWGLGPRSGTGTSLGVAMALSAWHQAAC